MYLLTVLDHRGVFVPTQIINFAVVPHHLRFFVVGVVRDVVGNVAEGRMLMSPFNLVDVSATDPTARRKRALTEVAHDTLT